MYLAVLALWPLMAVGGQAEERSEEGREQAYRPSPSELRRAWNNQQQADLTDEQGSFDLPDGTRIHSTGRRSARIRSADPAAPQSQVGPIVPYVVWPPAPGSGAWPRPRSGASAGIWPGGEAGPDVAPGGVEMDRLGPGGTAGPP